MNFIDTAAAPTLESRIDTALQQRYREPVETIAPAANETLATLFNHRSVRAFLPKPLAEGTLELLIAAAQSASTSSNIQAWSVVAVEDPEARARLSEIAGNQQHIIDAPLVLVWVADLARIGDVAARRNTALEAVDFTEPFLVATIDAALAAQNAFVAAESLGLGATYIGALRNRPAEVAEIIGLPPRSYPVFGLVVGHPDPDRPTAIKPRLPQSAVLHRDRYSLAAQHEAIARHDVHTLAFRGEQRLDPQSWSDLVVGRLRNVSALKGRHMLREVLDRLGFPLK
jgi:nitroreductase